ncbi:MAG TPA: exosortase/archaeosortase family protein [Candidatus Binatia bacterium]|nr:exosortase/archaeosortase family protein [Candidatus Binatia bacterium]
MKTNGREISQPYRNLTRRGLCFAFLLAASCLLSRSPLRNWAVFATTHDYGSHIFLVAPISVYLIYLKRVQVFSKAQSDVLPSSILFLTAGALKWVAYTLNERSSSDYLWLEIVALLLLWTAAFIVCYGMHAFRAASFPFFFLLLIVPAPDFLMQKAISSLQEGSAAVAFWLFKILNVPVFREGLVFHIPTLDLEIARECSGIRSSVVLLITTLLLGEFLLRTFWSKTTLVLSLIPIVILKNGLRIVTISMLTIYVNRGFLYGWLHKSGGIVFYLLGLLALVPMLKLLKTVEMRSMGLRPSVPSTKGMLVSK